MPSIMTLEGARARLGDEWDSSAPAPAQALLGDAAYSFISWGVLAFAVGTAAIRGWAAFGPGARRLLPSGGGTEGARRRRRRRWRW